MIQEMRITPARAGTTFYIKRPPERSWDHPRSRGDHNSTDEKVSVWEGSPPLARGPQKLLRHSTLDMGITPARAGTT